MAISGSDRPDGRSRRWAEHREARRVELVAAAVRAIEELGREASVEEIAKAAGVSKPVLYRYFTDKVDLHAAVGRWGTDVVVARIAPQLAAAPTPKQQVRLAIDAYLETIEEHPQVFLLLVQHRAQTPGDPLADGKLEIAELLATYLRASLSEAALDVRAAEPLAQGLVGLCISIGEWWLINRTMTRDQVAGYLFDFTWGAMLGIPRSQGLVAPRT